MAADLFLQLNHSPFMDAQYEMVLLHPEHFLPCGTSLGFCTKSGSDHQLSSKYYVVRHDCTLQEAPGTEDCSCLPTFSFGVCSGHLLNPFLVILSAEINFQHYRRMELPPLSLDVKNLIDLTIKLVELIYWEPNAEQSEHYGCAAQLTVSIQQDSRSLGDIDMAKLGWIMGKEGNNKSSIQRSRTGGSEIQYLGKNATLNEWRAYGQYLISSCGTSIHLLCSNGLLFD